MDRLKSLGLEREVLEQTGDTDLVALRRYLFARSQPPVREPAGDVRLLLRAGRRARMRRDRAPHHAGSAPRRAVRRDGGVRARARSATSGCSSTRFGARCRTSAATPRLVRSRHAPPASRRPRVPRHPRLRRARTCPRAASPSTSRSAQVPRLDEAQRVPEFVAPDDEELGAAGRRRREGVDADEPASRRAPRARSRIPTLDAPIPDDSDDDAIVAGTLRAPWKWETLIVESAVIGGDPGAVAPAADGAGATRCGCSATPSARTIPDSPKAARIERDLRNLGHLRAFALPIVDLLAAWPASGDVGRVARSLRGARADGAAPARARAARARSSCARWRPIGPVSLDEARDVIADRLQMLEIDPPTSRYGRVFVGSPQQARGRTFRVVFVAGLAERMFPQRPHEDPMLLDREMREPLGAGLRAAGGSRAQPSACCCGSRSARRPSGCGCRIRASKSAESRPRVPSFYALDIMRAITGRIPQAAAAPGRGGRRRGRRPRLAGAGAAGRRDRRSRARPLGAPAAAAGRAAARRSAATRTICCA